MRSIADNHAWKRNAARLTTLLFCGLWTIGADIPHLGVISPTRALTLDPRTERVGFRHFLVEIRSESAPTNIFTLTVTNGMLAAADMVQVPSGPGIMGVRSVYEDSESEPALYRYDLRRAAPPMPLVTVNHILTVPEPEKSLTGAIGRLRAQTMVPTPPVPGQPMKTLPAFRQPLPSATNRSSYAEHVDWLADRAAKGLRRSE